MQFLPRGAEACAGFLSRKTLAFAVHEGRDQRREGGQRGAVPAGAGCEKRAGEARVGARSMRKLLDRLRTQGFAQERDGRVADAAQVAGHRHGKHREALARLERCRR